MRISDWSSDVCSSDLLTYLSMVAHSLEAVEQTGVDAEVIDLRWLDRASIDWDTIGASIQKTNNVLIVEQGAQGTSYGRSEEHTSELQSLMRISYAVFCLKKKTTNKAN